MEPGVELKNVLLKDVYSGPGFFPSICLCIDQAMKGSQLNAQNQPNLQIEI